MVFTRKKNIFIEKEDWTEIILENKNGEEIGRAIIDKDKINMVANYRWSLDHYKTVVSGTTKKQIRLARLLLNIEKNLVVRFKNNNKLDYRIENLYIISKGHNSKGSKRSEEARKIMSLNKLGDKNPAKRQDVRNKIRESVLKKYEEDLTYKKRISDSLKKYYQEHPESIEKRKPRSINQYSTYFTSIEKLIADELTSRGAIWEHNTKVGRYFPDFLIDDWIIEVDGINWHNDEEREKKRDTYLEERGYIVSHLKEKDIHKSPNICLNNAIERFPIISIFYNEDDRKIFYRIRLRSLLTEEEGLFTINENKEIEKTLEDKINGNADNPTYLHFYKNDILMLNESKRIVFLKDTIINLKD